MLNQNIDEDQAKSTAQMRSYKFEADKIWPEEEGTAEIQIAVENTSTPIKTNPSSATAPLDILSIPLYKRLLEDNSFNSSLDEDLL